MEGPTSTSHYRSISLPSRFIDPSYTEIEKRINELKGSGNFAGFSQTIQINLVELAELYVCVDKLVRFPHTQQALSNQKSRSLVEDVLEGSIGLLDSCSVLKDLTILMKENVQSLQSALRRKGGDPTIASQIATYRWFRKRFKKTVVSSLHTLTSLEKKMGSFLLLDVDHHALIVSKVFREVYALAISIFKSILVFMSLKTKPSNGVQFLSRFVSRSTSTCDKNEIFVNEVESVDMATMLLHKSIRNNEMKNVDVQMTLLKKLQILDVSIDGFAAGLESLFRRLVQTRASLLNIVVC